MKRVCFPFAGFNVSQLRHFAEIQTRLDHFS